jgi:chromosome segregation protein
VAAGAAATLTAVERAVQQAADARDAAEAARTERETALTVVRTAVDGHQRDLAQLTDAAHRDEVARAEQRLRIEQLRTRSVEDLGIDPDVLVEEYGPHQGVPVVAPPVVVPRPAPVTDPDADAPADGAPATAPATDRPVPEPAAPAPEAAAPAPEPVETVPYVRAEQEKRLRAAERALSQLGRINPLALEEFAALEERHRFLVEQLADLKKSRADLLEIVREIDERVEQVFADAYRDTAAQFDRVFPRLFPGGEGRLVLTDPSDMLTTGIEVEARPAGKKVKRLSLLSGGERSLTAVALLVSIFKARPSPFYVMDEVEAALDDANLGRLLEIFRELQEDSQLIVVTHQKRTMEIADALYGVTMRGDGVTTVISQRLRDEVPA